MTAYLPLNYPKLFVRERSISIGMDMASAPSIGETVSASTRRVIRGAMRCERRPPSRSELNRQVEVGCCI
jgi:hypothetical protein